MNDMKKSYKTYEIKYYPEIGLTEVGKKSCPFVAAKFPRAKTAVALSAPLYEMKGVYLLVDESGKKLDFYVGESTNIRSRFVDHCGKTEKVNWSWAIVFLNANCWFPWNKDEVNDIQGELIKFVRSNGFLAAANAQKPKSWSGDEDEVKNVISEFESYLPLLCPQLAENLRPSKALGTCESDDRIVFHCRCRGCIANGYASNKEYPNGFTVLKGAKSAGDSAPSFDGISSQKVRDELVRRGHIDVNGVLTRDYEFTSPSAAAEVFAMAPENGLEVWKLNGKSLRDYL